VRVVYGAFMKNSQFIFVWALQKYLKAQFGFDLNQSSTKMNRGLA
jgi:hypothetical protein